jgi:hypothetical protein
MNKIAVARKIDRIEKILRLNLGENYEILGLVILHVRGEAFLVAALGHLASQRTATGLLSCNKIEMLPDAEH